MTVNTIVSFEKQHLDIIVFLAGHDKEVATPTKPTNHDRRIAR